jgi:hypothetical protein
MEERMEDTIGVLCPFTGKGNLPVPTSPVWAGRVPGENIWYFSHDEVESDGLADAIGHLIGEETATRKTMRCIEALQHSGNLQRVGEWWFLRLPQLPRFELPGVGDIVLAVAGGTDIVSETRSKFETYAQQLQTALMQ